MNTQIAILTADGNYNVDLGQEHYITVKRDGEVITLQRRIASYHEDVWFAVYHALNSVEDRNSKVVIWWNYTPHIAYVFKDHTWRLGWYDGRGVMRQISRRIELPERDHAAAVAKIVATIITGGIL